MAKKKPIKYFVVDAFTESAFKGNPAAVCFLGEDDERDDAWLQSVAVEFKTPITGFLTPITGSASGFRLRWFSTTTEVDICGHVTLASAHTLFSNGLVDTETIEFSTRAGVITAKRVPDNDGEAKKSFLIELRLPMVQSYEYSSNDLSMLSKALDGTTIVDVKATSIDYIIVELPSMESVIKLQPRTEDIFECPGKMVVVTAAAPAGSDYDFMSRCFAPKIGVEEPPVCGSAHCALAHYWSLKLNKSDFVAFAASRRRGKVMMSLDMEKGRVLLRGRALTVMEGLLVC
ncbi:PREDICTED: uncharacterized protein LOC104801228 [Tarenaya hassleriana]|uniref:uncharacterized protein LOC104801228 n=1 Tax=Tarenaya hassleriana TaxID=28532 RepID=UPI00053C4E92|nr:PREDICTED: uncharacterized protein LOC104801228 [Tarenaya hassleriana]